MMEDEREENKCTALVPYEPKPLTLRERAKVYAERKRQELEEALQAGKVRDPITAIVTSGYFISAAISAGLSVASALISRAFAPKQPTQERGRRSGELVINAELGQLIPEVYFGDPGDGYGGSWVPGIIGWVSGIKKFDETSER